MKNTQFKTVFLMLLMVCSLGNAQSLKQAFAFFGGFNSNPNKAYSGVIVSNTDDIYGFNFSESGNTYQMKYVGFSDGLFTAEVVVRPAGGKYKAGELFSFAAYQLADECTESVGLIVFERDSKAFLAETASSNDTEWEGTFLHSGNNYTFNTTTDPWVITKTPKNGFYKVGEKATNFCLNLIQNE